MNKLLLISIVFLSGCIAKSVDVKTNAENISLNSKNISKSFDLISVYHKTDTNDGIKKEMQAVAKATFEESLKSKGLTVSEDLPKAIKTAGSLSAMAGIPYGGVVMDVLAGLLGLFGGKKIVQNRAESARRKDKEEEDWKYYLASLNEAEAEKAIKANGI